MTFGANTPSADQLDEGETAGGVMAGDIPNPACMGPDDVRGETAGGRDGG